MPVVPTGPISLPLANLQALLAHCDAWRDWVGGAEGRADVDAAGERIFLIEPTKPGTGGVYSAEELEELRPFIVVDWFDQSIARRAGSSYSPMRVALGTFRFGGMLSMSIEDNLPEEDAANPTDALIQFMNRLGALTLEMGGLGAGAVDYLTEDEVTAGLGGLLIREFSTPLGVVERVEADRANTQGDHLRSLVVVEVGH